MAGPGWAGSFLGPGSSFLCLRPFPLLQPLSHRHYHHCPLPLPLLPSLRPSQSQHQDYPYHRSGHHQTPRSCFYRRSAHRPPPFLPFPPKLTSLVNHILRNVVGLRCAVFVNEFGSVGIDTSIIQGTGGGMGGDGMGALNGGAIDEENVVMLDNGCICCEINEDLVHQMERILDRQTGTTSQEDDTSQDDTSQDDTSKEKEKEAAIDCIIVETSGVCDPAPVLETLQQG